MPAFADGIEAIPGPLEEDDGDVAWALTNAQVQWSRGARAEAARWLHRAVEAATEAAQMERAAELELVAQQIGKRLQSRAPSAAEDGAAGDAATASGTSATSERRDTPRMSGAPHLMALIEDALADVPASGGRPDDDAERTRQMQSLDRTARQSAMVRADETSTEAPPDEPAET